MKSHRHRHEGLRWTLYYGSYSGIERFALEELQAFVQDYLPYVIECRPASAPANTEPEHRLLIGTAASNPMLAAVLAKGQLARPTAPEGFSYAVLTGANKDAPKTIVIAGFDSKGALNGVVDFCTKAACRHELGGLAIAQPRLAFDSLGSFDSQRMAFHDGPLITPLFAAAEAPVIEHRGLWTWGYVIYDYRRYLDNMARLKMNMLVVWNDVVPLNIAEIIAYAHLRGIKMIAGFHWGWGIPELSLVNPDHLKQVRQQVLDNYATHYRDTGFDGIYFQTATEHSDLTLGGRTIAAAACHWVNDIGRALLEQHPDLVIQFGLHATSIMGNYMDLQPLDPRIQIVWEDAGALPYAYLPKLELPPDSHLSKQGVGTFEETLAYSLKLASFRGSVGFGLCPKGWGNIDWAHEFENHHAFVLGCRNQPWIERRLADKRDWWSRVNRDWIPRYEPAARFYAEIRKVCKGPITAVGLVEDGLFEAAIQPSVAAFAETLWNPNRSGQELHQLGSSSYYTHL
jgi:hypothetical protein